MTRLPFFRLWLFCGFVLLAHYVFAPFLQWLLRGPIV